jgi:hypothetical protein
MTAEMRAHCSAQNSAETMARTMAEMMAPMKVLMLDWWRMMDSKMVEMMVDLI